MCFREMISASDYDSFEQLSRYGGGDHERAPSRADAKVDMSALYCRLSLLYAWLMQ